MTNEQSPMTEYEEVVDDLLGDLRAVADILLGEEVKKEKVFIQEEEDTHNSSIRYGMHVDLSRNIDGTIVADWTISTMDGEEETTERRQFIFPAKALGSARALLQGITPTVLFREDEPEPVQQLHALLGNLLTPFEVQRDNEKAMDLVKVMKKRESFRRKKISQLFEGI